MPAIPSALRFSVSRMSPGEPHHYHLLHLSHGPWLSGAWPPHPRLEACRFLPGARSPHHKATQQQRNKKTPVEVTVHTWTSRPGLFCFHALQPGTTCRSLFVSDFFSLPISCFLFLFLIAGVSAQRVLFWMNKFLFGSGHQCMYGSCTAKSSITRKWSLCKNRKRREREVRGERGE